MLQPVQALRRAEAQLEKQLGTIQVELDKVRGALQMLRGGKSATGKTGRKRRKMSAATRAKMRASAKRRWAAKKQQ